MQKSPVGNLNGSNWHLGLVGVLMALAMSSGCGLGGPDQLNVVLVTFDTTRADYIGCYGDDQAVTPNLDALAAEGVLFARNLTPVPITMPSHASIMTGRFPNAHGVRDNGLFSLAEDQVTLAEVLLASGYKTAAAIGSFPLLAKFGLNQGFEFYDDHVTGRFEDLRGNRVLPKAHLFFDERRAGRVNQAVFPWLEANHKEPFFLWVHYFDPHQPFEPPPPYDQLHLNDPYRGEIAYADECFGALMEKLRVLGAEKRTVVVFTADHGEGLGDHNEETHSMLLYDTTVHVPLIIRVPGGTRGAVVKDRVGTVDIMPTLLELLAIEPPPGVQGQSLVGQLKGESKPGRRFYAETLSPRLGNGWGELRALYDGDYKLIFGPRRELFDLREDAGELGNLVTERPEIAARMEQDLAGFLRQHSATQVQQADTMDAETRASLEALGYLQSAADTSAIREELDPSGPPPQDRIGDINLISTAKTALFKGRYLQAKQAALALLESHPENPTALEMLASANLGLGLVDQAQRSIERLRQLAPDGTPLAGKLMHQLGAVLHFKGDHLAALDMLKQSQVHQPSASGQAMIASVHKALGQDRSPALRAALELDPGYVQARVSLAIYHAQRGENEEAEAEFRRAISDQPYFPRPYYNFGTFLSQTERLAEAEQMFYRAIEVEPKYPDPYYALVALNLELGREAEARRHYSDLVARVPGAEEIERARQLLEEFE